MKIKKIKDLESEFTYDIEVDEVHEYLLGNGCVSHNTSSIVMRGGATEGTNPPKKFIVQKTSGIKGYQIAPEFWKYREFYITQFAIPNEIILKLAQIRQLFLDQAQSIDTNYTESSAGDVFVDIFNAEKLGIKTLYYANSEKEKEVCESCGS